MQGGKPPATSQKNSAGMFIIPAVSLFGE